MLITFKFVYIYWKLLNMELCLRSDPFWLGMILWWFWIWLLKFRPQLMR